MNERNIFWNDDVVKSPSENLAINRYCVDLIHQGKYDVIARTYLHDKGIILGNRESIDDVNVDFCKQEGYEITSRPTGGSAIVTGPNLTLCYSVFYNSEKFGDKFNIHDAYKSITFPLAKNLGEKFSIVGNYYLRYELDDGLVPIAGHAMKSYNTITQFDGVINIKKFDMDTIEKVLRLRELWVSDDSKYLEVEGEFYDLQGKKTDPSNSSLEFIRSEKRELEKIIGLEDIGMTVTEFKRTFKQSLEEVFGTLYETKFSVLDEDTIHKYEKELNVKSHGSGQRFLGHCFVDLVEEEQETVYSGKNNR
ncbi:MAG: biotin/lipoate A/B protein ligase family protein [Candidatus Woesearchaeota archaeon]